MTVRNPFFLADPSLPGAGGRGKIRARQSRRSPAFDGNAILDTLRHWRILASIVFEEFAPFTRRVMELLDDDGLVRVQEQLLARPDAGKVIPKSGGLRKLRVAAKGHGKRGGARMIYYWVVAHDRIRMMDIYAKNEKEDLSAGELKQPRNLIEDYKT
jgi:hypothetical protein